MRDGGPPLKRPSVNLTSLQCEETRLTATLIMEGKLVTATIDTGATRSFINPEFAVKLGNDPAYEAEEVDVILADGSKKTVSTAATYNLTLGNVTTKFPFLMMAEFNEDVLLGLDFLRTVKATIICAGLSVTCEPKKPTTEQCRIVIDEMVRDKEEEISETITNKALVPPGEELGHRTLVEHSPEDQQKIKEFLETELPKFQYICGLSNIATHTK